MMKMIPVFFVLVVFVLTSCGVEPLSTEGSVTYWSNRPDAELPQVAKSLGGLTLVEAPGNVHWSALVKMPDAAPDLVFVDLAYDVDFAARQGLLADLTPYRNRLQSQPQQWKGLQALVGSEQRPYFLPSTVYLWRLFYNVAVLEAAGIQVPTTLSELELALETLRGRGVVPMALGSAFGWPALAWLTALDLEYNGESAYRELVQGRRKFDDPSLTVVYESLARWRDKGWFDPDSASQNWPESLAKLAEGKAGFTFMGASAVNRFPSTRDIKSLALPPVAGKLARAQLAGVQGFVLSKKSLAPEASLSLADAYLQTGVAGQVDDTFRLPAIKRNADPSATAIRSVQLQELEAGALLVPQLDRVLEPQAAYDANQVLIRFFAKDSPMTASELGAALFVATRSNE